MQLKILLNNFNDIFATYKVPPASHKIIHQEINQMLDNGLIQPSMNALDQTLGAVLLQKKPDGREHLVAYASHSLNPAEKNYGTPALKHLAIYWAVIK
ncbi:hypothetical protein G9A89_006104 [Geosiphon pyriformis]|nr:hypothetical protein G9A89_006104 [Geosiphon pyriformis]